MSPGAREVAVERRERVAQSQQGRNVVVGPLVYSLALGMSVGDMRVLSDRSTPSG